MITDDQIAELFARANPIPTTESSSDTALAHGTTTSERSSGMTTVKPKQEPTAKRRAPLIAIGFAVVLAAVLAVSLLLPNGGEPDPVADASPEEQAIHTVEALFAALTAGDAETATAFLETDQRTATNTNAMDFFAALPGSKTVSDCTGSAVNDTVRLTCATNFDGPLMQAVGEQSEGIFRVREGSLTSLFIPGDRGETGNAFAEYTSKTNPEAYDQACNPDSYKDATVIQGPGLVFAGPCGQLWAEIADDAAAWVSAGKPPLTPGDEALQTVEDFTNALNDGDPSIAKELLAEDQPLRNAAGFLAALPGSKSLGPCTVRDSGATINLVCPLVIDNATFRATGETSVPASFTVVDGLITTFSPGSHRMAGSAMVEYLSTLQQTSYEEDCAEDSYEPGSVLVSSDRAVFSGACGELWAQFDEDIGTWIALGRPSLSN